MPEPTPNVTLEWGQEESALEERGITSPEDLDQFLSELQERFREDPQIVVLSRDDAGSLSMGVGRDRTVLGHTPANLDPPYRQTVGDQPAGDDLVFFIQGHWTDFPARNGIPTGEGFAAMQYFMHTGQLSPKLVWEEV